MPASIFEHAQKAVAAFVEATQSGKMEAPFFRRFLCRRVRALHRGRCFFCRGKLFTRDGSSAAAPTPPRSASRAFERPQRFPRYSRGHSVCAFGRKLGKHVNVRGAKTAFAFGRCLRIGSEIRAGGLLSVERWIGVVSARHKPP